MLFGLGAAALLALAGTGPSCTPARGPADVSSRSPVAQKWLERARASYAGIDLDDASDALRSALDAAPNDSEVRTWAGRVALARLDYAECVRLLQGIELASAYEDAFVSWDESGEAADWDVTAGDHV